MLAVLQDETADFDWAIPGLQLIGRAQFDRKAWQDARHMGSHPRCLAAGLRGEPQASDDLSATWRH
jgi:hypothetical protein